jgi:DUF4097 and DUF4098 domain-containing protein YvlB
MLSRSVFFIAMLAAFPALAATPINETRPLDATGQVHISNVKGSIIVRTWNKPEVRVTGSLGKGVEKLAIDSDPSSIDIEVKFPNNSSGWNLWGRSGNQMEPTVLEVTIPQRASLDIESVSANVDVQQMAGRKLSVASVSAPIVVTASSPGQAEFENVSGDITLRITSADVEASSVSGDIRLGGGMNGQVDLETVSGNISLLAQPLSKLDANTVSGDLDLKAGLKPGGTINIESLSGEVGLKLLRNSGARVHVETFSGDIQSPSGKVHEEEHGPGKSLDTTLGDGRGQINVESFSGDVNITLE